MTIKKRILLISSSSKTGGGPSHIFLLRKILKKDIDFYLAMPKINLSINHLKPTKYIEICERKISLFDLYKLVVFVKKNKIEIIHSHGKGAGILGRIIKVFLRKPHIYTFHGIHTRCLSKFGKIIYILYENFTGWIDDEKIFVSSSEKEQALKLKISFGKNFSIINNATKKMQIRNANLSNKNYISNINNKKKNIVSICRLVDQKNIFEIFNIAKNLPIYNFLILGDGYLYYQAKEYLKKEKINNVYLLGNQKDIFKHLYCADLFLSSSLYEGHPISILEAISIGIPVVASKVTGNIDTIKHGDSGFFYELGNIGEAVSYIDKILNDSNLRKKFSINAFKIHRKKFTIKKLKKSYFELYRKY